MGEFPELELHNWHMIAIYTTILMVGETFLYRYVDNWHSNGFYLSLSLYTLTCFKNNGYLDHHKYPLPVNGKQFFSFEKGKGLNGYHPQHSRT